MAKTSIGKKQKNSPDEKPKSPTYQQLLTIDNKGKGDCAFLAFSIGLIALAQKEYLENQNNLEKQTPCYDKLLHLMTEKTKENPSPLTNGEAETFIKRFHFHKNNKDPYLDTLQNLLRADLYHLRIAPLTEINNLLVQEEAAVNPHLKDALIYSDTIGLFWYYLNKIRDPNKGQQRNSDVLNSDIARNPTARKKMQILAEKVNAQLNKQKIAIDFSSGMPASGQARDPYFQTESKINAYVVNECFIKAKTEKAPNFSLDNNLAPSGRVIFNNNSLVAWVLKQNTGPGRWGTEQDLIELASGWNVTLLIHQNALPLSISAPGESIIRVNQPNKAHWTTLLDPFMGQRVEQNDPVLKFKSSLRQAHLTKREIHDTLLQYKRGRRLLGFFYSAFFRNHVDKADNLIKMCTASPKKDENNVADITKEINTMLATMSAAEKKGEFARTLDYLKSRCQGSSLAQPPPVQNLLTI